MHIKFSSNLDFDFGVESVQIITGSIANKLQKRGSAKDLFGKWEATPGQTDVHLIALGSYEGTGANRNLDIFRECDCRNNHDTFVKAGRALHRNHKNKPKDPKFGNIKASAYNEVMRRVELIVGHDNDKCSDILDKIEKTGNAEYSMAANLAYDVCTWCGHKAKDGNSRCSDIPHKLGEINKLGVLCAMDNPNPNWFEISFVKRGADRIAQSLKICNAPELEKAASDDFLEIYKQEIHVPDYLLISKSASDKRSVLRKLAKLEKHLSTANAKVLDTAKLANNSLSESTIEELRKFNHKALLTALAEAGITFSPEDFCKYLFGNRIKDKNIKGMKSHLPNIFNNILSDDDKANETVNSDKFELGGVIPKEIKNLMKTLMGDHSLFEGPAQNRIIRITIASGLPKAKTETKEVSKEAFDKELAHIYANYKIAALNHMNDTNVLTDALIFNSLAQNA